jgi:hypothetical protein
MDQKANATNWKKVGTNCGTNRGQSENGSYGLQIDPYGLESDRGDSESDRYRSEKDSFGSEIN